LFFAGGEKVDRLLGAVPEEVIRSKVQEILERVPADERRRLRVVVSSWVGHDRQDAERFRNWLEKAEGMKADAPCGGLLAVASEIGQATERLARLLSELYGVWPEMRSGQGAHGNRAE